MQSLEAKGYAKAYQRASQAWQVQHAGVVWEIAFEDEADVQEEADTRTVYEMVQDHNRGYDRSDGALPTPDPAPGDP